MIKYLTILFFLASCTKTATVPPIPYTELVITVSVNNEPFKVKIEKDGRADSTTITQSGADMEYHFRTSLPYTKGVYSITFPDPLYGQSTLYMQVHRGQGAIIKQFQLQPYY